MLNTEEAEEDEEAKEHAEGGHDAGQYKIFFFFLQLLIGQLMKRISQMTGIPFTSLITVYGIIVGYYWPDLGKVGESI